MGKEWKGRGLRGKTMRARWWEREVLALEQVQFEGVDAGNGSSPEVEGAVLKEAITFRVFLLVCCSCWPDHFANAAVFYLVGGCIWQTQAFQLRQIQFWDGHPPEKKGAVLATHRVPHSFLLSINYWRVPKMEGVPRGLRDLCRAGEIRSCWGFDGFVFSLLFPLQWLSLSVSSPPAMQPLLRRAEGFPRPLLPDSANSNDRFQNTWGKETIKASP